MTTDGIAQIAVIGAGLMGHGIAQEFASAGYHVLCTMSPTSNSKPHALRLSKI